MLSWCLVVTLHLCSATATLVGGMGKGTTVPEYINFFDQAVLLRNIPQGALSEDRLTALEQTFYSALQNARTEQEYVGLLSGLSNETAAAIKKESLKALVFASPVVRSSDLSAYSGISAATQRRALMAYEAKFVELLQAALKGSPFTISLKKIRGALISAQREYRQEGHGVVQWMGYASVAFSILALASVIYFLRVKGDEGGRLPQMK